VRAATGGVAGSGEHLKPTASSTGPGRMQWIGDGSGSADSVSAGVGNQTTGEHEHRVVVCDKDGGGFCVVPIPLGWPPVR